MMFNRYMRGMSNGGIATEANYPYAAGTGKAPACDKSKLGDKAGQMDAVHNEQVQKSEGHNLHLLLRNSVCLDPVCLDPVCPSPIYQDAVYPDPV